MTKLTLEKDVIIKRVEGIEEEVVEMQKLAAIPFPEFSTGNVFKLAQYHLHRALEGTAPPNTGKLPKKWVSLELFL